MGTRDGPNMLPPSPTFLQATGYLPGQQIQNVDDEIREKSEK